MGKAIFAETAVDDDRTAREIETIEDDSSNIFAHSYVPSPRKNKPKIIKEYVDKTLTQRSVPQKQGRKKVITIHKYPIHPAKSVKSNLFAPSVTSTNMSSYRTGNATVAPARSQTALLEPVLSNSSSVHAFQPTAKPKLTQLAQQKWRDVLLQKVSKGVITSNSNIKPQSSLDIRNNQAKQPQSTKGARAVPPIRLPNNQY